MCILQFNCLLLLEAHQKQPRSCRPLKVLQQVLLPPRRYSRGEHCSCRTQPPAVQRSGTGLASAAWAASSTTLTSAASRALPVMRATGAASEARLLLYKHLADVRYACRACMPQIQAIECASVDPGPKIRPLPRRSRLAMRACLVY